MQDYRFQKGSHFLFGGQEYIIECRLSNADIQLKDVATNSYRAIPEELLIQALFDGVLEFLSADQTATFMQRKAVKSLISDFTLLSENLRTEAKRRYAYINGIKGSHLERITSNTLTPVIKTVSKIINDTSPPSWITLYRWFKNYTCSGEDIRALVPSHGRRGNHNRKIDNNIVQIINDVIAQKYLSRERPTIQSVYNLVIARITRDNELRAANNQLCYPDRSTIYDIVNKVDPYSKTLSRYGKKIADQKHRAIKQCPPPTRPLERVEIDHTKLDLFVVDLKNKMPIGRPWFTTAIDVYSKVITGMYLSFNPPSYLSIMQCLRHAIMPKNYVSTNYPSIKHKWGSYGIPEMVVVDNAKEFISTHFEDSCLQLGILIQYAPPQLAWYKATVERYFGSLNTGLVHQQPGTTFSNIFERGDYDSAKNAVISFEALLEIIHKWIIDIYHQQEHRTIIDVPARVWETAIAQYPPALPATATDLRVLLGQLAHRKITPSGIELHGLLYNDERLALLRQLMKPGEKAVVKYDPTDLSIIYVFDPLKSNFIAVAALSQEYTKGLSLWQHCVIKNYARQRVRDYVDIVALSQAKEEIQQLVEQEWKAIGRNTTRQKLARWKNQSQSIVTQVFDIEPSARIDKCITTQDTAPDKLISPNAKDNPLAGISDLGSAFTNPAPTHGTEQSTALSTGYIADSVVLSPVRKRKRKKRLHQGQQSLEQKEKPSVEHQTESCSKDGHELDLTGWSADYNLPK